MARNEEWKFKVNDKGNVELTLWNKTDSDEEIPDTSGWEFEVPTYPGKLEFHPFLEGCDDLMTFEGPEGEFNPFYGKDGVIKEWLLLDPNDP